MLGIHVMFLRPLATWGWDYRVRLTRLRIGFNSSRFLEFCAWRVELQTALGVGDVRNSGSKFLGLGAEVTGFEGLRV